MCPYQMLSLCVAMVMTRAHTSSPDESKNDSACPTLSVCSCREDRACGGLHVDCSGKGLTSIPTNIPAKAVCLYLDSNNITEVMDQNLQLPQLKVLDLSKNAISMITKDAFVSLTKLEELHLEGNRLVLDKQFPSNIFFTLSKLKSLHLHDNRWQNLHNYTDDLFTHMHALETLHLDGLPGGIKLGEGFGKLKSLKSLYIYGGFDYVSNDTFANFGQLAVQLLYIKSECLYNLEELSFGHFPQLRTLSLSNNRNLGFVNMSHGWYGLQYTQIENLFLQRTAPILLEPIILNSTFFTHLEKTYIKTIFLDKNSILFVRDAGFHTYLPYLEVLSFEYNRVQSISEFACDLYYLKCLKYLSLSYQLRRYPLHPKKGYDPTDPENVLASLGYPIYSEQSTSSPHICNVTNIAPPDACDYFAKKYSPSWEGVWRLPCPPKLETLKMAESHSDALDTLPLVFMLGQNSFKVIDYSGNGFTKVTGPMFFSMPSQEELKIVFANNDAVYLSPTVLQESIHEGLKLVGFDLSGNRLGPQFENDINIFSFYKDLKHLNLSGNSIKTLPSGIFSNLLQLESLNLSSNSLQQFGSSLTDMKELKFLDLSHNLFTFLGKDFTQQLDSLAIGKNFTIDLFGNPIQCSCQTIDFLSWMKETEVIFHQRDKYSCLFNRTITSLDFVLHEYFEKLQKQCASKVYIIATSVILGSGILAVVLGTAVYRHRWDIKFFCLQLVSKRKKYCDASEVGSFKYGAFVSYSVKDIAWVKNILLPMLEDPEASGYEETSTGAERRGSSKSNEERFKLYLHHRNFLPGHVIEETIIDAINKSYKTLLVLTNNFVKSEWCEFELQMARMKCFDKGRDIIVVIMKEPVPASSMSKTLRAVIRRTLYIEWPEDVRAQPAFWANLKKTLRAPEVAPLVCECGKYMKQGSLFSSDGLTDDSTSMGLGDSGIF